MVVVRIRCIVNIARVEVIVDEREAAYSCIYGTSFFRCLVGYRIL